MVYSPAAATTASPAAVREYSTERPARRRSTGPASSSTFGCRPTEPSSCPVTAVSRLVLIDEESSTSTPALQRR